MGKNETCKAICQSKGFDERSAAFVNSRIKQAYNVNILVDGLPAAELQEDPITHERFSSPGFPLGKVQDDGTPILHNHWDIIIDYHKAGIRGTQYRVVGVIVNPSSHSGSNFGDGKPDCAFNTGPLSVKAGGEEATMTYTYSVFWRPSTTAWATRWDKYLHVVDPKIHWFSLINSTVFVVFLVGMVSSILVRALRKDIARYSRLDNINLDDLSGNAAAAEDDIQEDSGMEARSWRYLPSTTLLVNSQRSTRKRRSIIRHGWSYATLCNARFLVAFQPRNPDHVGWLHFFCIPFLASFGGYISSRSYKTFGGENWKLNIASTPALVPGIVFIIFFLLNLFVWGKGSSGAVPLTTMLAIIAIWFLISVPLSVAGSWFGFKQAPIESPTRVNQIPRQIPPVSRSLQLWPSILMTGVLPFCSIFVELYFIMTSLWTSKIYYMFGFLFICYGLMVLTSACTTIMLGYFLLCAEDYRWQWRAFIGAGMTGGYVFINGAGILGHQD